MILISILAGVVVVAATLLLAGATLASRASRRRRTGEAFSVLSALRGPSGQPFFPETPEEQRREERLLTGWDPTYDGEEGADPDRWKP